MGGPSAPRAGAARTAAAAVALAVGVVLLVCSVGAASETAPAGSDTASAAPDTSATAETLPDRVAVYYFHRTIRCSNCMKFESYTEEAIREAFPDELSAGALEWVVLNYEDAGSKHLVDDYCVNGSSVIVVEFRDNEQRSWANLDAIWGFVKDKPTFLSYIRSEVGSRLDALSEPEDEDSDTSSGVDQETSPGR